MPYSPRLSVAPLLFRRTAHKDGALALRNLMTRDTVGQAESNLKGERRGAVKEQGSLSGLPLVSSHALDNRKHWPQFV